MKTSHALLITATLGAVTSLLTHAHSTTPDSPQNPVGVIQLIDKLDRPKDGFCVDVIGYSPYERLDLPLIAHNCKKGLFKDQAMSVLDSGEIYLPAYNKCLTAIAPHTKALPGATIMARDCGEHSHFLETPQLQQFEWQLDGKINLHGSNLCLAAGERSDQTSSPSHRWRTLSLQHCKSSEPELLRWQFIQANHT
ncbi:RICIN domain-containing protein [Vibrio sp. Of7-15]|uniref:RICIN domain-containing protein n=1 Tax=Vibrio sp. Of7-15 TaxID=2724879 RepID=UPI001EF1DED1|nr:RICIN domain-containing protein [Vibrio sp. Of7-15]MCG7500108.1 RICIN domain-containing protein [Vibrio sp. Of7-15]